MTLHHFTVPRWFADTGGWLREDAVQRFSAYVEAVLPVLAGVRHIGTINEPNMVAMFATLSGWEDFPPALGGAVRRVPLTVPGVQIIVTENGIATADDDERIDYTREALHSLRSAIADGVEVGGYLHWSLLDKDEWGD